jgi:glutathione peroxidase
MNFYDYRAIASDGSTFNFEQLQGKTVLIVNTASKCGFTYQYEGLEKLYKEYKEKDFVILGFPCDQFAHQEPGTDSEISQFCSLNYGVTFPLMGKVKVNGKDADPLFKWLKSQTRGLLGSSIKWNFTKFLISKDGKSIKRFSSKVEPKKIADDIKRIL